MYREDVLQPNGTFKRVRRWSSASSADVPLPSQLEARLRKHLQTHDGKTNLLFINHRGRPYSANKLRAKVLHPLLVISGAAYQNADNCRKRLN